MKKQLLITGAYGLAGSNICKILERDYPDIEITKIKCDIATENNAPFADYVVFASGYGQPAKFSENKLGTINLNTQGLQRAFKCLKFGGKFLYVSSSEVYSGAPSPHKETDIGTTTPQHPRACYIEGKRCGEAVCMAYKEQGYDVKIARLALAYGPGTKKGDTRVLNQIIEQSLTRKEINLWDNGQALRTYVYVEDAAQMMLDVLFNGKEIVYNIGGESTLTVYELAHLISRLTSSKLIVGDKGIEGAPSEVRSCLNRINAEFPRTFVNIEDGIKRTIEYQKELYGIK
jgi:UDP-glucuronate decarboxylase